MNKIVQKVISSILSFLMVGIMSWVAININNINKSMTDLKIASQVNLININYLKKKVDINEKRIFQLEKK